MNNFKKKLSILMLSMMLGSAIIPTNLVQAEDSTKESATSSEISNDKLIEEMTYTGKGLFTTNILEESLKKCVDDQGGGDGSDQKDADKNNNEENNGDNNGESTEENKKSNGWGDDKTNEELKNIGSKQDDNKVQESLSETTQNGIDTLAKLAEATCEEEVSIYKDFLNVTKPVILTNIKALMGMLQYIQGMAYALVTFMVVFYGYELMFKREEAPDIFRFSFKLASTVIMIMLSPYIFQDLLNLNNIMVYYIGTMEVYKSSGFGAHAEAVSSVGAGAILGALTGVLGMALAGAGVGLVLLLLLLLTAIALLVPIFKLMLWWYVRLFTLALMFIVFPLFILLMANEATEKIAKRFFVTVIAEIFSQTFFAIGYTVAVILLLNLDNLKESMGIGIIGKVLLAYVIMSSLATFPETAKSWLGGSDSLGYKSMANNLAKSVEGIGKSVMKGSIDRQKNKVNSPTSKRDLLEKTSNGQSVGMMGQTNQSERIAGNTEGFANAAKQMMKDQEEATGGGETGGGTKNKAEKIINDLKNEESGTEGTEGNESAKQDGGGGATQTSGGAGGNTGGKTGSAGGNTGGGKENTEQSTKPKDSIGEQKRKQAYQENLQKAQSGDSVAKQADIGNNTEAKDKIAETLAKDFADKNPNSAFSENQTKDMLNAMMGKGGAVPKEEDVKALADKIKADDEKAYNSMISSSDPTLVKEAQALKERMESDDYKNSAENFIQQAKDMGGSFAGSNEQGLSDKATSQIERGLMNGEMTRDQAINVAKNDLMKTQGLSEKDAKTRAEEGMVAYEKGSLEGMGWEAQRSLQAAHKAGKLDDKKFSEIIKNDQIHHKGVSDIKQAQGNAEMIIAKSGLDEHVQRRGKKSEARKEQASTYKANQQAPLDSSKGGERGDSPS